MDCIQRPIQNNNISARDVEFAEKIDLVEGHTHDNWNNAVDEARYIVMINCTQVRYGQDVNHESSQGDDTDLRTERIRTVSVRSGWTDTSGKAVELQLPVLY